MRRRSTLLVITLLMTLLPHTTFAQGEPLCFDVPTISSCVEGRFRQFWEHNGGLRGVSGIHSFRPICQRRRRGIDANLRAEPLRVSQRQASTLRRIPRSIGRRSNWSDGASLAGLHDCRTRGSPLLLCTGHAIAHAPFANYWLAHGINDPALDGATHSLALFGLPLSQAMPIPRADGTVILTQWFNARASRTMGRRRAARRVGDETKPAGPFEPSPVPAPLPEPAPPPPPPTNPNVVYLTFDDGPFVPWTAQVLDAATF